VSYASALSEHPVTSQAVGEAAGQVLEKVGPAPDLAVVFVTPPHAGALEDAARAVESILRPRVVLGCAAESVLGVRREVEGGAAVSLWAGSTGGTLAVELEALQPAPGEAPGPPAGWPGELPFEPSGLVLLADPFSFPTESFLTWLASRHPGLPAVGGQASGAMGPGGSRLFANGRAKSSGAVGALLGPGAGVSTVVSQGCRPIGRPLAVTRAEANVVYELAGQPALSRLMQLVEDGLPERDIRVINQGGLHLGFVIDEHREEFTRGDFLVRNVIGADRSSGAIAVGEAVEVGTTVQFHLRDAAAADEDLRCALAGAQADAALVFTCNGRGTRLFGSAGHDAGVLADLVGEVPASGFFAAGEIGPVGGRNFLHGFTASIALFSDR
jgi:small ligand-binding sensory domain FIST